MDYFPASLLLKKLSRRELEILQLVFSGNTSKEIAVVLELSPRTVEVHRANIMNKMGVSSIAQLSDVVLKGAKTLEELLLKSQAHLEEAQKIAHLGSWTFDIATGRNTWSDEMYRIFGYIPGAISPSYDIFFNHLLAEDHDRVKAAVAAALSHERAYDIEYRIARVDGEIRNIKAQGIVEWDYAGAPLRMVGTVLDITEHRRAIEAVYASEAKFATVFEHSPVAAAISTLPNGVFVEVNQAFVDFYGYPREELIGHTSEELHLWADPEARRSAIKALNASDTPLTFEVQCRKKSGQIVAVKASVRHLIINGVRCMIGFIY